MGDRRGVDPEPVDPHLAERGLLGIEMLRPHGTRAAGAEAHSRRGSGGYRPVGPVRLLLLPAPRFASHTAQSLATGCSPNGPGKGRVFELVCPHSRFRSSPTRLLPNS